MRPGERWGDFEAVDIEHKHLFSEQRATDRERERHGLWSHLNKSFIFKKEFGRPRHPPSTMAGSSPRPSLPITSRSAPLGCHWEPAAAARRYLNNGKRKKNHDCYICLSLSVRVHMAVCAGGRAGGCVAFCWIKPFIFSERQSDKERVGGM